MNRTGRRGGWPSQAFDQLGVQVRVSARDDNVTGTLAPSQVCTVTVPGSHGASDNRFETMILRLGQSRLPA